MPACRLLPATGRGIAFGERPRDLARYVLPSRLRYLGNLPGITVNTGGAKMSAADTLTSVKEHHKPYAI